MMVVTTGIILLKAINPCRIKIDLDNVYRDRCNKYSKILEIIARAIHFHGRQGLALRRHRETLQKIDKNQNLGTFLTYLKQLQNYCPEL